MNKLRILVVGVAAVAAMLLTAGSASAKDRNHDRIPDKWEKKFNLSLKVDQANKDQDRDKVDNRNEFQEGTNPRDKDSDNDGVKDGKEDGDHDGLNNKNEDMTANLPDDKDTDNDGIKDDDENAGTIASFDQATGTLTINLAGGGQVSGLVTQSTEIECEDEDEIENEMEDLNDDSAKASHDDNSGPGSVNSGPGNDEGMDDEDEDDVCTTADLTPNTVVHEAELENGVFREVELVK